MKKNLLLVMMLSAFYFNASSQSQTKTANLFNWNGNPYVNLWKQEGAQYVAADDNSYAYSKKLSPKNSFLSLVLQDFRFDIPAAATIENITVRVRRFKTGNGSIHDYFATLLKASGSFYSPASYGLRWTDQTNYPATESAFLYTSPGEGSNGGIGTAPYTWTPAIINDAAFGVRIDTYSPIRSVTVYYDVVDITVNYSEALISHKTPKATAIKPLKEPFVFPNPFTTKTAIQFTAAETGQSIVELYNNTGARVQVLYNGSMVAGQLYTIVVGDMLLQKGIYTYSISNGKYRHAGRIIKVD